MAVFHSDTRMDFGSKAFDAGLTAFAQLPAGGIVATTMASGPWEVRLYGLHQIWERVQPDSTQAVILKDGTGADAPIFGKGLALSGGGFTAGTVQGWSTSGFLLMGTRLDAATVSAAARSKTLADDAALLRKALGGNDLIILSGGNDRVSGLAGRDLLGGNDGNDRLEGGKGADVLTGGAGNDRLLGGAGGDLLAGGDGYDTLAGGAGNDLLDGSTGDDRLTGGKGADIFAFRPGDNGATVTDFNPDEDRIVFYGSRGFVDATIAREGGDTRISFNGGSILLLDTTPREIRGTLEFGAARDPVTAHLADFLDGWSFIL